MIELLSGMLLSNTSCQKIGLRLRRNPSTILYSLKNLKFTKKVMNYLLLEEIVFEKSRVVSESFFLHKLANFFVPHPALYYIIRHFVSTKMQELIWECLSDLFQKLLEAELFFLNFFSYFTHRNKFKIGFIHRINQVGQISLFAFLVEAFRQQSFSPSPSRCVTR